MRRLININVIFDLFSELMLVHYKADPELFKPAQKNDLFHIFVEGALTNVGNGVKSTIDP